MTPPSVAEVLHDAGYRTALIGTADLEPYLDLFNRFEENSISATGAFRKRYPPRLRKGPYQVDGLS